MYRPRFACSVFVAAMAASFLAPAARAAYTYTTIDVAGSSYTSAYGINALGQVVGTYADASGNMHGFPRSADGSSITTIDPAGSTSTMVTGINDSGQIVGFAQLTGTSGLQGFIRAGDGSFTLISNASANTFVTGINNSGQVSGYTQLFVGFTESGFIRSANGTITPLGYNSRFERAYGINDAGQVTVRNSASPTNGAIRNADGTFLTLPSNSLFSGIDNLGRTVGFGTPEGKPTAILLAADRTTFTTLDVFGSTSSVARGLNDAGSVVGEYRDLATGRTVGFLATAATSAVPEPASLALTGLGLLGLVAVLRRGTGRGRTPSGR